MGDPDLKSEELVERISREAARGRKPAPTGPKRVQFPREDPLGQLSEVAFLNESVPLKLAPSRGFLAGLRYRFKGRVALPLLTILRPVIMSQVALLNNVVNRIDLLLDRSNHLAVRIDEVAEDVHFESKRVGERAQLLHDLLEARVERLEQQAAEAEPPAG